MVEPGTVYGRLELRRIRQTADLLSAVFRAFSAWSYLDRTGEEIDAFVEREMSKRGLVSALKGYRGFPGSSCLSPNEIAVHGIPGKRKITRGDIFTLDIAAGKNGWMTDGAWTFVTPGASERSLRTVAAAWQTMRAVTAVVRDGVSVYTIAQVAEGAAGEHGATVIPRFAGHGIGKALHEAPRILFSTNGANEDESTILRTGNVVAVEPVVTVGCGDIVPLDDGWGYRSDDRAPVAHFEIIVEVTDTGCSILSLAGISGNELPREPQLG